MQSKWRHLHSQQLVQALAKQLKKAQENQKLHEAALETLEGEFDTLKEQKDKKKQQDIMDAGEEKEATFKNAEESIATAQEKKEEKI